MIQSLIDIRRALTADPKPQNPFPNDDPRHLHRWSLEQQKKRAKELLRDARERRPDALQRLANDNLPFAPAAPIKLHHAQHTIARENGFSSWAKFQAYIASAQVELEAVKSGQAPALDDKETLHLRCGGDIMQGLAIGGFEGDFLTFADPVVDGPVPATDSLEEYLTVRAEFIAQQDWATKPEAIERFRDEYASLLRAKSYRRVMIWCEHDPWDMTNLARMLSLLGQPQNRPHELGLVVIDHFPGVKKFVGIGQLPADALRTVWRQFKPVTDEQLALCDAIWRGITADTPQALYNLIRGETPALPAMAPALNRHLQELPSVHNGLSLSEALTLQILQREGPMDAVQLFYNRYTTHYEPLPFFGDSSYWIRLQGLAEADKPAIHIQRKSEKRIDWNVSVTDFGLALLEEKTDWLKENRVDRWLGGIHIRNGEHVWRWHRGLSAPSLV